MSGGRSSRQPWNPFGAMFAVLMIMLPCVASKAQGQPQPALQTLRTARQAHEISRDEAARAYPVRFRGVVTYYDAYQDEGKQPALFVEDATGGIFVQLPSGPPLAIRAGSVLEVSGKTDPGGYAPIISHPTLRITGSTEVLPKPRRMTMAHLLSGAEDGQWVEVEGIVHAVDADRAHVILSLATTDGLLTATIANVGVADAEALSVLVDAKVMIRAVAAPIVDNRGEMTGVRLLCPDPHSIVVEQEPTIDPFNAALRPLNTILQYSPGIDLQHRIHVRGRLTLYWPGRTICIQEGSNGLCVQTNNHTTAAYGQWLDVAGFPTLEDFQPTLSDATLRTTGGSTCDAPTPVTVESALSGVHDSELVQIEGRLIGKSLISADPALLLSSGQSVFPVILPPSAGSSVNQKQAWAEGTKLRVTGVLIGKVNVRESTRRQGVTQLESFQIALRSRSDIAVLERPSWWTAGRTLMVLAAVATLTLAVLIWVIVLHRRVDQQTLLIRRSEERFRHLAEHDALTGLASRASLLERLNLALERARNVGTPLAILMMDLDHFKHINDSYGHATGDQVLSIVARRLQASFRNSDTLARMGGDEFLAILPGVPDRRQLGTIAADVVSSVAVPIALGGAEVAISVSVGISIYPDGGEDAATLLHHGDLAMYRAKMLGRNCYLFFAQGMNMPLPAQAGTSHENEVQVLPLN